MTHFFRKFLYRSSYPLVFGILGLAAAYYGAATLTYYFAPSRGYFPLISPAAGIGFCSILLFGYRIWPGVLIGSFLFNFWAPISEGGTSLSLSLALAGSIGVGATLQALAGAFLVRCFIGFPNPLDRGRDALAFLILAGPAACLINATWSVVSLAYAAVPVPAGLPIEWLTWWAGDTLGVLLLTPLVLVWFAQPRPLWARRHAAVSFPIAIVFGLIVIFMTYANHQEERRIRLEFARRTENIASLLRETIDNYLDVLHALESFYASSERMERRQFRFFVERMLMRFPGIQALSWNPILSNAERAWFEQAARREGYAGFEFRQRGWQGQLVRAETRPEYVVVYLVEPYERNKITLGFDRASDRAEIETLRRARDQGRAVSTPPLTLVQDAEKESSIIVFQPIYRSGQPHDTERERRQNIVGYVAGAFRVGDVIRASLATSGESDVEFMIRDEQSSKLLYAHPALTTIKKNGIYQTLYKRSDLEVAGRRWILEFQPTAKFIAREHSLQTWIILVGGLLFTVVLGAFVLVASGQTARVERLVEERTTELEKANKERADFTAMIIHDLRSPLHVITGVAQIMEEGSLGPLTDEQRDWFGRIKDNSEHMVNIVSDFLDVSKLEAGRVALVKREVELGDAIQNCLNDILPMAKNMNISLKNACPQTVPKLHVDPRGLKQVLFNLLSNALKFTSAGGEISVGCEPAHDHLTIWVKDSGVGISREDLPRLFEKYRQTEAAQNADHKGTGLGLVICKMILEAHGGKIWVDSAEGEGTTFYFTLPLAGD